MTVSLANIFHGAVNMFRFLLLLLRFVSESKKNRRIFETTVYPLFRPALAALPPVQARRLDYRLRHYATVVSAFFGPLLYRLHNRRPDSLSRETFVMAGAATAFFDMVFDDNLIPLPELRQEPSQWPVFSGHACGELFVRLYGEMKNRACLPADFQAYVGRIIDAQSDSCRQKGDALSFGELAGLTRLKGGLGLLIFRCFVPGTINSREETALMDAGEAIQLMDDMADVWQDLQEGITTLAHHFATPADFAQHISLRFPLLYQSLCRAGFDRSRAAAFCFGLYCSFALGRVHAGKLTRHSLLTKTPLQAFTKEDVRMKMTPGFWVDYIRQIWNYRLFTD